MENKNILERNKLVYSYMKSKIDFKSSDLVIRASNINLIRKIGQFAWRNHPGCFFDAEIENLLMQYGRELEHYVDAERITREIDRHFQCSTDNSTLHIATEIANVGGHTRIINQIIKRSKEKNQGFILTYREIESVPIWFKEGVEVYVKIFSISSYKSPLEKAFALRLIANRFKRVILYHHPFDVIPSLAFAKNNMVPVAIENHAHSWFWFGKSIADMVFCHTEYHTEFTKVYRKIDNCFHLSFTQTDTIENLSEVDSKKQAREHFNIDSAKTIILTVATREKFIPNSQFNYFEILQKILQKNKNVVSIVVGLSEDDVLVQHVKKSERLLLYPPTPDLTHFYLASDICLESMPQPSLGVQYEAPIIGLSCPFPKFGKSKVIRSQGFDRFKLYWEYFEKEMTENEFYDKLELFINNRKLCLDVAREIRLWYLSTKSDEILYNNLSDMYRLIDKISHTPTQLEKTIFYEDEQNIEIAERSELQNWSEVLEYWKAELRNNKLTQFMKKEKKLQNGDRGKVQENWEESPFLESKKNLGKQKMQESDSNANVKTIAFYLPQFHPIPENDKWWGTGFTEWTNVTKAKPLFKDHYQPQLPSDLGFTDLRLSETRVAQAKLAQEYGINGFCYWHYWFNGRKLLERPFEEVLESGEPNFPFCLAWAYENWTRRWDGHDQDILMGQPERSEGDDINHFQSLLPAFKDPRYIKINDKPLFLFYRPDIIPHIQETLKLWEHLAKEAGLGGIYFMAIDLAYSHKPFDWTSVGFDAELAFQPSFPNIYHAANQQRSKNDKLRKKLDRHVDVAGGGVIFDYKTAWPFLAGAAEKSGAKYCCVTPAWDNSARKGTNACILHDSTPQEYGKWLRREVMRIRSYPQDERVVFVNAWNEWAEGNHLEPDQKFGRQYLETTRIILAHAQKPLATIVILTFNALKYTKKTVESVLRNTIYPYEIIFVDNNSTDGTPDYLKRVINDYPIFKLIQNSENKGFAAGNNQGVEIASGKYILLLNNDVLVADGWLTNLVSAIDLDDHIGMVGPITNHISGRQMITEIPYKNDAGFYEFAGKVATQNKDKITPRRRIAGFVVLMKKDLYQSVGGLDESFGSGNFEDDDLCLKVRKKGYSIHVHEGVFIHHYGSQTFKVNKLDYSASLESKGAVFKQKWPDVNYDDLIEVNNPLSETHPALYMQGMQHLEAGEYDSASEVMNQLIIENPLNEDALIGLTMASRMSGQADVAITSIRRVLKVNPDNAIAYNLSGLIAGEAGNLENAKKLFQAAIEKDNSFLDARRNYAEILLMGDEFSEGVQCLMDILEQYPEDIMTLLRMAELNIEANRIEEAVALAKKVLEIDPTHEVATKIIQSLGNEQ